MYTVILFDLDGTLTDPKPGITRSVAYALERMGMAVPDVEALTPFIGPPLNRAFMQFSGFDEAQARTAVALYREYFSEQGMYENDVYAGIPQLLARLQGQGRRLLVATSKPQVFAQRILEYFNLAPYFTHIFGSDLDLTRSDKALIVADALASLPATPLASAVMIGDREHDIIGARANQIDAIGATYGYGSAEELRAAGATAIVGSVDQLARFLS